MPRRRALTDAQLAGLLALPAAEALVRRLYGMVPGRARHRSACRG